MAALGGGILIAQVAVFAAARRAGRTRPAEALREAAIEHARPGVLQLVAGVLLPRRRRRDGDDLQGQWAVAFAILDGMLLAVGVGLLGRVLLGLPAALLACPLRRFGASGLLRQHEPGRQPLADRRAGDADRARRDARGHAGHRPDQRPARHRGASPPRG